MSVRDVVQAAAGALGGEATYVEDVFSTYLYDGNGSTQTIENGIALGDFGVGTSTDFDGSSDSLSRASDLTGNTDSKTFTFSVWFFPEKGTSNTQHFAWSSGGYTFHVTDVNNGGQIHIDGTGNDTGWPPAFYANVNVGGGSGSFLSTDSWNHLLISIDLTSTSTRHIFINDVDRTSNTDWFDGSSYYRNVAVDFTKSAHYIGSSGTSGRMDGKLAHLYLDYTYRDLSTASNRRIFIDANGGSTAPSTLSALSPILYLPMTEDYSIGENLGTGGDFTVNGSPTIVQSGTQYEAGYGQGGMAWIKSRSAATDNQLFDTERGVTKELIPNSVGAETTDTDTLTAFNADGFSLGADSNVNTNAATYASWTFRKAPKFFDVVTYTGTGSAQNIPHNLGSVPGCVIVKATTSGKDWYVYHRGTDATSPEDYYTFLNKTQGRTLNTNIWDTAPTDTHLVLGSHAGVNSATDTYVAYLFAHNDNDGEFGKTGDQDIIKCGSYTGNGVVGNTINLGFEPQWLLIKNSTAGSYPNWFMFDNMRGMTVGNGDPYLYANSSQAEAGGAAQYLDPTATGFKMMNANVINETGQTYIYIAIRRGPMKTPESGTEVFDADTRGSTGTSIAPELRSPFPPDWVLYPQNKNTVGDKVRVHTRLTGTAVMYTSTTGAESALLTGAEWNYNNGFGYATNTDANDLGWMFRRAPGFFDVVTDTGTGSLKTVSHNLGVAPELIIRKSRSNSDPWGVWTARYSYLAGTAPSNNCTNAFNFAAFDGYSESSTLSVLPTSTEFSVNTQVNWNGSGKTYVTYLFATLAGVSKVGRYTGTGSNINVDCGFSSGARFVLIKRLDASGYNWYVYDTARGIVTGNDPYLFTDTTDAEVTSTDYIDPLASGFTVTSSAPAGLNASGGSYIFLAIA